MASKKLARPAPLFDTQDNLAEQQVPKAIEALSFAQQDFLILKDFLLQYSGSRDTFTAYRREAERLAQWAWFVAEKSLLDLRRYDIETYIAFCQSPPKSWIGTKKVARFINNAGERMTNPEWRMFVATTKKSNHREGATPNTSKYEFSQKALQSLFISISSFYNYLINEGLSETNPIAQIRQKSKYIRKQQGKRPIRRLTSLQWEFVIETAEKMADSHHDRYERTLFIMSALYLMYLRISELASTPRWEPQMGHFYQDSFDNWWFKTVGKGNKEREITVSDAMLNALKRYRHHRGLTPTLPFPGEATPLVHKILGQGGVESTRQIRLLVQECFNNAITAMEEEGFTEESKALSEATVHWLRHTGISDDLNKRDRPITHVRDDAGHTTSATTDLYNDSELQKRHESGRKKNTTPD